MFFSKSTIEEKKVGIKEALGVPEILHYDTYLGLPSLIGRHKKASFDYIKERMWREFGRERKKKETKFCKLFLSRLGFGCVPTIKILGNIKKP